MVILKTLQRIFIVICILLIVIPGWNLYLKPLIMEKHAKTAQLPLKQNDFKILVPKTKLTWIVKIVKKDLNAPCGISKEMLDKYGAVLSPCYGYPGEKKVSVIALHRYRINSIINLDKLTNGDEIVIEFLNRAKMIYHVVAMKAVPALDTSILNPLYEEDSELRIVTCLISDRSKRLVICAKI